MVSTSNLLLEIKSLISSILLTILVVGFLSSGNQLRQKSDNKEKIGGINNPVQGKWVRIGHTGLIGLEFKANGLVEIDFGNDQTIEIGFVGPQNGGFSVTRLKQLCACTIP